jgi:hypothetical protein
LNPRPSGSAPEVRDSAAARLDELPVVEEVVSFVDAIPIPVGETAPTPLSLAIDEFGPGLPNPIRGLTLDLGLQEPKPLLGSLFGPLVCLLTRVAFSPHRLQLTSATMIEPRRAARAIQLEASTLVSGV